MKVGRVSIAQIENLQAASRIYQMQKKVQTPGEDKIAVSENMQVFQSLLQKAKEIPVVREERVNTLMNQIEQGEFKAESKEIADKMLVERMLTLGF